MSLDTVTALSTEPGNYQLLCKVGPWWELRNKSPFGVRRMGGMVLCPGSSSGNGRHSYPGH